MTDPQEMEIDVESEYAVTLELQAEIESLVGQPAEALSVVNPDVSNWSIGMQLEHILLANRLVSDRLVDLVEGRLDDLKPSSINRLGRILLGRGIIPRGKADAPAAFVPETKFDVAQLREMTSVCRDNLTKLAGHLGKINDEELGFEHPYFGVLSAPVWMRFLHVHTLHHLKIIREINAGSG